MEDPLSQINRGGITTTPTCAMSRSSVARCARAGAILSRRGAKSGNSRSGGDGGGPLAMSGKREREHNQTQGKAQVNIKCGFTTQAMRCRRPFIARLQKVPNSYGSAADSWHCPGLLTTFHKSRSKFKCTLRPSVAIVDMSPIITCMRKYARAPS